MLESQNTKLQFKLDWRASLLALILLPILLTLGFWQLDRAEEKRSLQNLFDNKQQQGAIVIENLNVEDDLRYQPVSIRGTFINERALLLDNRIYQGKLGYEIVVPFVLHGSQKIVLVNRGWLQGDRSRRTIPTIPAVEGTLELIGEVYVPQGKVMQLAADNAVGWPRVVQSIDIEKLASEFGQSIFPYTIRLKSPSSASFIASWVVVNLQPEKHIGYAVQWFAMSGTLLLIMIMANTNSWAVIKSRRNP